MVKIDHEHKTMLLWPPTLHDSAATPMAGKQVIVPLLGETLQFTFHTVYGKTEDGYMWLYYIPLPHKKEDLKQWLIDICKNEGIKLNEVC